jgi:CarD family transcriptional regulator
MEFKLGEKVVYPNHGVGVIEQISYGYLNGRSERYYMLKIVSSGLKVMVPQTNVDTVGLRPVVRSTEAGSVISYLEKGRSASHHDWKHRFKENSERMRTGSLMEVAAVLKGLVSLSRTKPLSFREKKMLERAKHLLVTELATVRNTTEQTMESNLVRAMAKAHLQMPEALEKLEN